MKHHTWNKVASSWKDKLHFTIIRKFSICWMKYTMSLKDHHFNESCWAVLSNGTVYYAVQGGSNFWVWGWNPMAWPFKWKLLSSTFLWYYALRGITLFEGAARFVLAWRKLSVSCSCVPLFFPCSQLFSLPLSLKVYYWKQTSFTSIIQFSFVQH